PPRAAESSRRGRRNQSGLRPLSRHAPFPRLQIGSRSAMDWTRDSGSRTPRPRAKTIGSEKSRCAPCGGWRCAISCRVSRPASCPPDAGGWAEFLSPSREPFFTDDVRPSAPSASDVAILQDDGKKLCLTSVPFPTQRAGLAEETLHRSRKVSCR